MLFFFLRVEIGHLQTNIQIDLKDPFESCVVILHRNTALVGSYDQHLLKWEMHDLQYCFLETSLNIK